MKKISIPVALALVTAFATALAACGGAPTAPSAPGAPSGSAPAAPAAPAKLEKRGVGQRGAAVA